MQSRPRSPALMPASALESYPMVASVADLVSAPWAAFDLALYFSRRED